MKVQNAINKLEKSGWNVKMVSGALYAEKDDHHFITVNTCGDKTNGKFAYESRTSCAQTHFSTLKQAINV